MSILDGSQILSAQKVGLRSIEVQLGGDLQPNVDLALMTISDPNGVDPDLYSVDIEDALQSTARRGVQLLVNHIFALPTKSISTDGIFAVLPSEPTTILPRAKTLPKIKKDETKWEKFAKSKGIAPKKPREKLVYDEEKQDWVPVWGYKGKNKQTEDQWIVEVPNNSDPNFDPVKAAKDERKGRTLKNAKQQMQNIQRAKASELKSQAAKRTDRPAAPAGLAALESNPKPISRIARQAALQRQLKATKFSTASLGKFDQHLTDEKKVAPAAMAASARSQGRKRKFPTTDMADGEEQARSLKILKTMGKEDPKNKAVRLNKKGTDNQLVDDGGHAVVNARKAIRHASKGKGTAALASGKSKTFTKGKGKPVKGKSRR